jgi:hypothetical protein
VLLVGGSTSDVEQLRQRLIHGAATSSAAHP